MAVVAIVTLNLQILLGVAAGLVLLLVVVSRLHRHPSRVCPNCGRDARLSSNTCRHCRYRFEFFRF